MAASQRASLALLSDDGLRFRLSNRLDTSEI